MERYGHYFDQNILHNLREVLKERKLDVPSYDPAKEAVIWFKIKTDDLDPFVKWIDDRRWQLLKDLRELTDIPLLC